MQYSFTGKTLGCELTKEEQLWLHEQQPRLFYLDKERKAYGYFSFSSCYNDVPITDTYEIAIDFARMEFQNLPIVYELGGRIAKTAKLYNLPLIDLHQYSDKHLCLIRPDAFLAVFGKRPFNIAHLCIIINSHLYWQSHYERHGFAPWPGEEHGWEWLQNYFPDNGNQPNH